MWPHRSLSTTLSFGAQEKPIGEFATLWRKELEEDTSLEQVELAPALADIMAVKDTTEQVSAVATRGACVRVSLALHRARRSACRRLV